jgi:predicted  nucleic acid-binding Zn-ribbon protein
MTDEEAQAMRRENDYLKSRNAQLQSDVTSLGGQVLRMQQELERLSGRHTGRVSDPLSGGQS